ncbi:DUF222 domain-containing protein [Dermatophilaceae bacterium Sec6.4]
MTGADPLDVVGAICGRLNAAHAELIALVARLVADDLWAIRGVRSVEHWLTCFAGVSPSTARDLVRIATRSGELPALGREVASGRLSLGQAAVVAAHTPVGYDTDVVDLAVHATVPQLRRALVKYDFTETPPGRDIDAPQQVPDALSVAAQPAELVMRWERDRFHLEYSAPADIGALVERALVEAKDALFLATQGGDAVSGASGMASAGSSGQGSDRRVRMADAMEQLATRSLHVGTESVAGRASKFRIYLHLDTNGQGWVTKRGALPGHLLRKWTCDGLLQPIWETEGSPVNVGRSQRIVPDRTRRLVEDRDRGCAFPGCLSLHHVECHHITHWADGGATALDNLISLCPHHHDRHHIGDFSIHPVPWGQGDSNGSGRRGRFEFRARAGWVIEPVTAPPPPPAPSAVPAGPDHRPDNGSAHVTDQPDRPMPPRYIGPTNEVLHLDWVRFHRRPPRVSADEDPAEDPLSDQTVVQPDATD